VHIDPREVNRALALVQSTSPNALLLASLDAARRLAAVEGHNLLERTMREVSSTREALRAIPGVEVLDERLVGRPGVVAFDAIRLSIDVRRTRAGGHAIAAAVVEGSDVHLELISEDILVAHCGMGEEPAHEGRVLHEALEAGISQALGNGGARRRFARAPSPGTFALSPREACMAEREAVALSQASGRVAAESLSLYPPGIATVLPGERISQDTIDFVTRTLELGGRLRGAADPSAATVQVVRGGLRERNPEAPASDAAEGDVFAEFPARPYLEKYYGDVGSENATMLRSITAYLLESGAATDTVVEIAGGPSLFSMAALAAVRRRPLERVLFTDMGAENLAEVERWVSGEAGAFDYGHLFAWLEREIGVSEEEVSSSLRSSAWELARFDWRQSPPPDWEAGFDIVSSHFFAESATSSESEFLAMLARVPRLARPGGTLLMSFMSRSAGYTIGDADFPAFGVDETSIISYLDRAGVGLTEVVLRTCPAQDPSSAPGYGGLMFVAGRLAP
jgi:hypothetical protein